MLVSCVWKLDGEGRKGGIGRMYEALVGGVSAGKTTSLLGRVNDEP
jgi:hypothetical protein